MRGEFRTGGIGTAAALQYQGIEPARVEDDEGGKRVFVYNRTDELTAALDALFDGSFTAPIRDFLTVQHNFRLRYVPRPS